MENSYFKDPAAFLSDSGPCYRPAQSGQSYTRGDFLALAHNDEVLARALFDQVAGGPPEQLMAALLTGEHDAWFQPLPPGNLDDYSILSAADGHYYDSRSLDEVIFAGGSALAATLQQMLDGQYGHVGLHRGEPGVLYCKAYAVENTFGAANIARGYAYLPIEYPEVQAFVCHHPDDSQALLCAWLGAGKLSGERLHQLHAQFH